jgi:aspartyl/glutamyl-tRNA(Asn/Gln) amidotransferase C subunit
MSIDTATAAKVAKLARIRVEEEDLAALAQDFNAILGFIEQLGELDVEDVEPMTSVTPMRLKRREDVVTDGDQQARSCRTRPTRARASSPCPRWWSEGGDMTELNALTIAEARDALRKGEVTSVELTEACLKAIDAADALNAVVHKTPEIAMDRAGGGCPDQGGDAPAMCGIPVGIKDLFCTEGVPSQAGSKILEGFRPEYESTVSGQLRDAGAVMLGKLNMDEFAMGSSNETSVYGNAVNPWRAGNDAALTPGGSSGGSAAAVAADLCLGATGTDTGGSIRQPAAFTGTVGLKPTYGRCSRWGIVAFASSLDQAGPMTKTVRDAAIMGWRR